MNIKCLCYFEEDDGIIVNGEELLAPNKMETYAVKLENDSILNLKVCPDCKLVYMDL